MIFLLSPQSGDDDLNIAGLIIRELGYPFAVVATTEELLCCLARSRGADVVLLPKWLGKNKSVWPLRVTTKWVKDLRVSYPKVRFAVLGKDFSNADYLLTEPARVPAILLNMGAKLRKFITNKKRVRKPATALNP